MIECTCLNCGWVHMAMTREEAGDRALMLDRCFNCGQTDTTNYRESRDGDCPVGCTIQPTIWDRDD